MATKEFSEHEKGGTFSEVLVNIDCGLREFIDSERVEEQMENIIWILIESEMRIWTLKILLWMAFIVTSDLIQDLVVRPCRKYCFTVQMFSRKLWTIYSEMIATQYIITFFFSIQT